MTAEKGITVAAVYLVPECRQLSGVEIAGDERRLAGTGRPTHPNGRLLQAFVQAPEEAFARMHASQPRTAELRHAC